MEVVVGTYEELILGYQLAKSSNVNDLETSFTDHSHTGCVRSVAVSEQGVLATGGSDESIRLFSLKKRKEIGSLIHHDGYISCLKFFGKSHMFSCSADGTIAVWNTSSWECDKTLKGHKNAVYYIDIHPTGKLALSVSNTKMCTWNLLTGKCAYKTAMTPGTSMVKWTPSGEKYIVVHNTSADIYAVETATVEHSITSKFRINCLEFLTDTVFAVGGEGGTVEFYEIGRTSTVYTLDTNTIRVKSMAVCACPSETGCLWLTTGSSDGWIKIWKLSQKKEEWNSVLASSVDTKFRIVSLDVYPEQQSLVKEKSQVLDEQKKSAKLSLKSKKRKVKSQSVSLSPAERDNSASECVKKSNKRDTTKKSKKTPEKNTKKSIKRNFSLSDISPSIAGSFQQKSKLKIKRLKKKPKKV